MGSFQSQPCIFTLVSGEKSTERRFPSIEKGVKVLDAFLDMLNTKADRQKFTASFKMDNGTDVVPPIYEVHIFGDRFAYYLKKEVAEFGGGKPVLMQEPVNWKY